MIYLWDIFNILVLTILQSLVQSDVVLGYQSTETDCLIRKQCYHQTGYAL